MTRRSALAVAAVSLALLAVYVSQWATLTPAQVASSDFTGLYVGGSLLRAGHGAAIYDPGLQASLQARLLAPLVRGDLPFVNPPAAAAVLAPLSLLPLAAAFRVWQAAQLLALVAAVALAAGAAPWPAAMRRSAVPVAVALAALAGVGTLPLGLLGQWDGVSALAIGGAYALWRRESRLAAGAALAAGTLLAKPHLAVGLAVLLVCWRDRRVLAGAAAAVVGLGVVSLAAVGPAGVGAFLGAVGRDAGLWPLASMLGFTGLTGSWLGGGALAQTLAGVASVAALAVCAVLGRRLAHDRGVLEPVLAAATVLSLLVAPHMLSQDLVLLAPLLVALTAWAATRDGGARWPGREGAVVLGGWAALCLAAGLDLGAESAAPPGRLVPWVLIGAAAWLASTVLRPVVVRTAAWRPQGSGRGVGLSPE